MENKLIQLKLDEWRIGNDNKKNVYIEDRKFTYKKIRLIIIKRKHIKKKIYQFKRIDLTESVTIAKLNDISTIKLQLVTEEQKSIVQQTFEKAKKNKQIIEFYCSIVSDCKGFYYKELAIKEDWSYYVPTDIPLQKNNLDCGLYLRYCQFYIENSILDNNKKIFFNNLLYLFFLLNFFGFMLLIIFSYSVSSFDESQSPFYATCVVYQSTLCGTLQYLAPELICNWVQGFAVDWWAWKLLFEMVLCRPPFEDDEHIKMYEKILD
ncbi:hypothetical protein RFI_31138 [Reticulomyxa filosa]|uniref:Protein kinase domain-containing protein n=1 Tax=Reticulomyxa filosa TaxID=46433 RepID=X6LYL6_RETFI|nr:hypothetical protein RFI_31138 [Reticulomyxa filosa]|eukprot:ETO06257.1 hypothetical protein RFI_31138 [Reticulomyxa filosa]